MRRTLLLVALLAIVCLSQASSAQQLTPATDPWYSTFSIIAYDPATKEFGVGVQSRAFGAGAAVPWAEAGVGAVATQAAANRTYGPKAMALLKQGLSPAEVVKKLTDDDPGRDTRQLAVIDTQGRSAVYTGKNVINRNFDKADPVHFGGYAGHVTGSNFSVQGNTLASEEVVKAMAAAYQNGKGNMAERLMDALDAGQSKGGDTRGMQSAGIIVVRPIEPGSNAVNERVVDIRVDDSDNPFRELRRLMNMTTGVPNRLTEHAAQLAKEGKFNEAIAEQKKALEINPRAENLQYALAQLYAQAGDTRNALAVLAEPIRRQPKVWKPRAAEDAVFAKIKDLPEFKALVSEAPSQTGPASNRPPMTQEQQAEAARRREAEMNAPRPIDALDTVWMEEMTWMEIRDAIKGGKTTAMILTGGVESNGPYLATGKHNFVLKVTGEAIARKLGNALVAPIVTLEPGRPDGPRVPPGSVFLSNDTYRAVLTDMATSLKSMGFSNVILIGDSGGNQTAMKEVAAALNVKYSAEPTRFYYIPEYYDYASAQRFIQANGVAEQIEIGASQGSDRIHDEYSIDALMALHDPKSIRLDQRKKVNKTTINGVPLLPLEKTLEMGKKIAELRAKLTVDAIARELRTKN